ncbi:MAG: hypothetical protein SVS15_04410 [Thermodesulfobacteriota bacterium]|nr:hypothetical protein [Thermodesulfobacteriota bacterium]
MKPENAAHPYWVYTQEILRYKLSGSSSAPALYPSGETETQKALLKGLKGWKAAKKPFFLLLGLGTGDLAQALDKALPPDVGLIVSELAPENARDLQSRKKLSWWSAKSGSQILADTSPWAHFHLWMLSGLSPENTFVQVNPELGKSASAYNKLRKIFTAARPAKPKQTEPGPPLTVAAILSPRDPGLPEFFRQIPPYVKETVVVWDAGSVPDLTFETQSPVRALARPLKNDFAAQRNAMLDATASGWVFSLDADERLAPSLWNAPGKLAALGERSGINAFYFPRQTLCPDMEHCLAGYGLWPDIQLRLFKKTPDLRFKRPVHEKLENVRGPFGLVLNAPLTHLNRILKSPSQVREKLALFDKAGKGRVKHRLSGEYPRLAVSFFPRAKGVKELLTVVLPHNPV